MGDRVDFLLQRFSFRAPRLYVELEDVGSFEPRHEAHIQLTDLVWFGALELQLWQPDSRQIPGLVPFAETLGGQQWYWHTEIDEAHPAAVVNCADDDEVALLYAPDFASFCYRIMLEEFTESYAVEREGLAVAGAQLADYAARLGRFLPDAWAARLDELGRRALKKSSSEGFYGVMSEDEYEAICHEDIGYRRLDEEFQHLHDEDN